MSKLTMKLSNLDNTCLLVNNEKLCPNSGGGGETGPGGGDYIGTNYRDTTTLSYVQNNGTPYFKAALTSSLGD